MSRELTAVLLAIFAAANSITFYLFSRSSHRIRSRQPGLPFAPLIALSLLGGALGALFGKASYAQMRDFPISRAVLGGIGICYAVALALAVNMHLHA